MSDLFDGWWEKPWWEQLDSIKENCREPLWSTNPEYEAEPITDMVIDHAFHFIELIPEDKRFFDVMPMEDGGVDLYYDIPGEPRKTYIVSFYGDEVSYIDNLSDNIITETIPYNESDVVIRLLLESLNKCS